MCSIVSACNNPSDSITEIVRLEQFDYFNQKENEVLYVNMENMDFLPQLPPASFSRARLARPIQGYWPVEHIKSETKTSTNYSSPFQSVQIFCIQEIHSLDS